MVFFKIIGMSSHADAGVLRVIKTQNWREMLVAFIAWWLCGAAGELPLARRESLKYILSSRLFASFVEELHLTV